MSAHLVLVTSNYPYRYTGGEVMFIAPEIPHLCAVFERVTVVPQHAVGECLPMPQGAQVDCSLSRAWRRWLWWSHLLAPTWPGFGRELARALRHGGWSGCARVWRWAAVAHLTRRWARRRLDIKGPTVLYTYWRGGSTLAFARLAAESQRVLAMTRVHGHDLYEHRFHPPFQPWPGVYDALTLTVPISSHGREHLLAAGVSPARVLLSRLGTANIPIAQASRDGVHRIVSCSWMVPVKRVPLIAAALVSVARRNPRLRIRWTHFGDGEDMSRVRQATATAPRTLEIRLPGAVDHTKVLDHYATEPVDLFILLSQAEGLPVSIQEAIAAGVPVLATAVGGVGEIVDPDNGTLLKADPDLGEVVAALERMLIAESVTVKASWRRASRQRWLRDFSADCNHSHFAEHLRTMAEAL